MQRRNKEGFSIGVEARAAGSIRGKEFGDIEVHAKQVTNCVVVFAPVQAAKSHRACVVTHVTGGFAEAVVDPVGNLKAVVFGQFGFDRRHGAVAQLCRDVFPQSPILFDVLNGIGFQEVDSVLRVIGVVAGGAVLRQYGPDGLREFVWGWRGAGREGEKQDSAENVPERHYGS